MINHPYDFLVANHSHYSTCRTAFRACCEPLRWYRSPGKIVGNAKRSIPLNLFTSFVSPCMVLKQKRPPFCTTATLVPTVLLLGRACFVRYPSRKLCGWRHECRVLRFFLTTSPSVRVRRTETLGNCVIHRHDVHHVSLIVLLASATRPEENINTYLMFLEIAKRDCMRWVVATSR